MGNTAAKCCLECFTYPPDQDEPLKENLRPLIETPKPRKPAAPAAAPAAELLPMSAPGKVINPTYFDSAYLEDKLQAAADEFRRYIDGRFDPSEFSEVLKKDGVVGHTKDVPDGYFLKFEWTLGFEPEEYIDFLFNEDRSAWDKSIDETTVVCWADEHTVVSYTKLKKIMIISPRDVLTATRLLRLDSGILIVTTSVEHDDYGLSSNFVRATVRLSGNFVQAISPDEHGSRSRVLTINHGHAGGNISANLVRKTICSNFPKFMKGQAEAIKKYQAKKA